MKTPCTGVILAGGQNSRMNKENKAFLPIGGKRIIDRILEVYRLFFDDIILVTNNPTDYYDLDVRIVTDLMMPRCSLAGIHTGLFHAVHPWALVLPCDVPFVNKDLVHVLLDHIQDRYSVIIPETSKGLEALFAVYSKDNIMAIEHALNHGRLKIQQFFTPKRVYKVSEKRLRAVDPNLLSFSNINSPIDFEQALKLENHQRSDVP